MYSAAKPEVIGERTLRRRSPPGSTNASHNCGRRRLDGQTTTTTSDVQRINVKRQLSRTISSALTIPNSDLTAERRLIAREGTSLQQQDGIGNDPPTARTHAARVRVFTFTSVYVGL
jgi:hypothetical protein